MEQSDFANPFGKLTAEDLNGDLLKYFFARPKAGIYDKITSRTHLKLIGGWGSGKTTLLQYIDINKQIQAKNFSHIKTLDFVGLYIKATTNSFNSFIKTGGQFKADGEILFGHYFNLLVLEKSVSSIVKLYDAKLIKLSNMEKVNIRKVILSKLSFVELGQKEKTQHSIDQDLEKLIEFLGDSRREISTMIDTRDLPQEVSYKKILRLEPTNNQSLLEEIFEELLQKIKSLEGKRFYILLDECESFNACQQMVINSIIRSRPQTMVFKLATRPPDIKTQETSNQTSGLTDREIMSLDLDRLYDSKSNAYRQLCIDVARNRLKKYNYFDTDIQKILGKFTIEQEIGESKIKKFLKANYPNKERLKKDFPQIFADFKLAAGFQILRNEKKQKQYAGFDTYASLSSGIMLQFIDLCRETFEHSKHLIKNKNGKLMISKIPLPVDVQSNAIKQTSKDFFDKKIPSRAKSLRDTPIDIEFGEKIQHIVRVLAGLFRTRLMTFNEPESTRIELHEGQSNLDCSLKNPIQQLFKRGIEISVFQEINPYEAKNVGGIKPPTFALNKILCAYPEELSPKPRWRTKITASTFNKILSIKDKEFHNEVLGEKQNAKTSKYKKSSENEGQMNLDELEIAERMRLLSYIGSNSGESVFKDKTSLILLHFLRDLIPFMNNFKKNGAIPSKTYLFYKKYEYPYKTLVINSLKNMGFENIHPIEDLPQVLETLQKQNPKNILIIEDGGIIVPKILDIQFQELAKQVIGAVEQTTKGIRNDSAYELQFPVISIPASNLKSKFEPPHVARSVIENIRKLVPDKNFSGKNALVVGYGAIGSSIALRLKDTLSMQVSVFDQNHDALLQAQQQGYETPDYLKIAVKDKSLIIGCVGDQSLGTSEILALSNYTYLVSASSEQWEFSLSELEALSNKKYTLKNMDKVIGTNFKIRGSGISLNLLADGYPINFWKTESMPNEVSDLILSLIFVSAYHLAQNQSVSENGIDKEIVNNLSEKFKLSKTYMDLYQN